MIGGQLETICVRIVLSPRYIGLLLGDVFLEMSGFGALMGQDPILEIRVTMKLDVCGVQ